jgi:predicted DNA-binding transcriptional regulator YafY
MRNHAAACGDATGERDRRDQKVGKRSQGETIAQLLVAFLEQPVWKQPDLQRRCGLHTTRAVRARVLELCEAGFRIEREEDPPHVYYTVEDGWFPGRGAGLEKVDSMQVARLLARLPQSATRDAIVARLVRSVFGPPIVPNDAPSEADDRTLNVLEDGLRHTTPVVMGYFSASRSEHGVRTVSVQRLLYGPRTRFVAYCHRSSRLKLFRVDRVVRPTADSSATYVQSNPRDVDAFLDGNLDGYVGEGERMRCRFVVRGGDAAWIIRNLPIGAPFSTFDDPDGVGVEVQTTAVGVLARHLTGLGDRVLRVEPVALRQEVRRLATGALAGVGARENKRSVRAIRSAI